ncbi:MAG: ferredoxin [Gammaproteobacteria bacterium]|nr:ferredoxin [Gammaproteobacteria bacterium]
MTVQRKHEMGAGSRCVCPKCGVSIAHRDGVPCQEERCPACGAKLLREGSEHHRLFLEKQTRKRQQRPDTSEK